MPRQPRLELPGVPMHVLQRGVNRCAIFLDDEDRHHYCLLLRMACERLLCGCMRLRRWTTTCTCWSRRIRLAQCLRRCGSAANRMCRPSTSGTGAAEPCGRGGSSPAWCRPNGMCSRSCAISNSIWCVPTWWHCQPNTTGQACTRIWGAPKASASRRTRRICILAAMQPSGCLSMQVASCGSSPRTKSQSAFTSCRSVPWATRASRQWWNVHWADQRPAARVVALPGEFRPVNFLCPFKCVNARDRAPAAAASVGRCVSWP